MTITADMTFGEIALLPEFAGFGEHLMLCRPSTWERMWNKPIVSHMNSDANPYETTRVLRGLNRIVELVDDGRQVAYDIWDEADCIRDPTRRNTKLFFFPGRPGAPFIIAVSGGGYQSVCHQMEGFPVAPELNDAGYNVFVLSYRVRVEPLMPRPIDDLNRAVRFVFENSAKFNVAKGYAVIGFSAGAHLTAEWGTDNKGFASYGCEAPKALVLCYAPIDLRGFENASDNRFLDSVCGGAGRDSLDDFCINQHVWEQYPPTYLWQCADDDIVSPDNYEKMVDALDAAGVHHEGVMYSEGGHALMKPHAPETDYWCMSVIEFLKDYLD